MDLSGNMSAINFMVITPVPMSLNTLTHFENEANFDVTDTSLTESILSTTSEPLSREDAEKSLERLSTEFQVLLFVAYTLSSLLSIFGNSIVICVLFRGRKTPKDLSIFLINLAFADLLTGICTMPFTYMEYMLGRWPNPVPTFLCPIVRLVSILGVVVSGYTLVAIGVDRYIMISDPFASRRFNTKAAWAALALIWSFALGLGFTQFDLAFIEQFEHYGHPFYRCREAAVEERYPLVTTHHYNLIIFATTFFIPFTLLAISYGMMAWRLHYHVLPGHMHANHDRIQLQRKIKIIRMLFVVVGFFFLSWLPVQVFNLVLYTWPQLAIIKSQAHKYMFAGIYFTFHLLSMTNSFVNPIIYCFMSENFQLDLKEVFGIGQSHSPPGSGCDCFGGKCGRLLNLFGIRQFRPAAFRRTPSERLDRNWSGGNGTTSRTMCPSPPSQEHISLQPLSKTQGQSVSNESMKDGQEMLSTSLIEPANGQLQTIIASSRDQLIMINKCSSGEVFAV